MPGYARFAPKNLNANPQQAAKILGELWNDIESGYSDPSRLKRDVETCETLIPDDAVNYFDGIVYVHNAICSLAYAVESELKGGVQEAVWAAEQAESSLFHCVKMNFGEGRSRAEMARIYSHPLIQAEFRRQVADLADLQLAAKNPGSEPAIIARIRRRAEADSEFFFRLP
jgi:hypothetical protein